MFSKKLRALAFFLMTLMVFYVIPVNCMQDIVSALSSEETQTTENEADTSLDEEVYVIGEDLSKREESAKHFRMSDGSYVAVQYAEPVHYLDANGEYIEYDNTLSVTSSMSDGFIGGLVSGNLTTENITAINGYKANKSDVSITLANSASQSALTSISKGEYSVSIIPLSLNTSSKVVVNNTTAKPTLSSKPTIEEASKLYNHTSSVKYTNLFNGADLEYVLSGSKLKENIIVNEKASSYVYRFNLNLTGLYAVLNEDGSISLIGNNTDKIEFTIPAGYMFDTAGNYSENVTYTLTSKPNGNYTLTVTADSEWINADDRAFPVTVDPTLEYKKSNITDISVASSGTVSSSYLCVGSSGNTKYESYIKLNELPTLPANAYIQEATLSLHYSSGGSSSEKAYIYAYLPTSSWDENVTYSEISGNNTPFAYFTLKTSMAKQYLDITEAFSSWLAGTSNFGIRLKSSYNSQIQFHSSEDSAFSPSFSIKYINLSGTKSNFALTSHSLSNSGTASVNLASGGLVFNVGTIATTDYIMSYMPVLTYNSSMAGKLNTHSNANVPYVDGTAGYGFKWSMSESIVKKTFDITSGSNTTYYFYLDSSGAEYAFKYDSKTKKIIDEDGTGMELTVGNTEYQIKFPDKTVKTFKIYSESSAMKEGAVLSSIADANGNKVTFTPNNYGRVSTIKIVPNGSSTATQLSLVYNTSGMISKILNADTQQTVSFYYSSSPNGETLSTFSGGYLRKIEYSAPDENDPDTDVVYSSVSYAYEQSGRISSIKDEQTGIYLAVIYENSKVAEMTELINNGDGIGKGVLFTYGTGHTNVRTAGNNEYFSFDEESDDIISTYTFDHLGRVKNAFSCKADGTEIYGGVGYEYENDGGEYAALDRVKHKLKSSASSGGDDTNYLLNGGFQNSTQINSLNISAWTINNSSMTVGNLQGNSYAKIPSSASSGNIHQSVFLSQGEYTLSFETWTNSATIPSNNKVEILSGTTVIKSENFSVASDQYTQSISFDVEQSTAGKITVKISVSDCNSGEYIYVDNVTLNKNSSMANYSLIQNGNFETVHYDENGLLSNTTPLLWNISENNIGDGFSNSGNPYFGTSLALSNASFGTMEASQRIYTHHEVAPQEGFKLKVSGYANGTDQVHSDESVFALRLDVYFNEGANPLYYYLNFDPDIEGQWQFASQIFDLSNILSAISEIKLTCVYSHQPGTAYFDNISVSIVPAETSSKNYYYSSTPESKKYGLLRATKAGRNVVFYDYDDEQRVTLKVETVKTGNSTRKMMTVYEYEGENLVSETLYSFQGTFNWEDDDPDDGTTLNREENVTQKNATNCTWYEYNSYGMRTKTKYAEAELRNGEVTVQTNKKPIISTSEYVTTAGSNIFGALKQTTDSLGNTTKYFYDETKGLLLSEVYSDGTGIGYEYDLTGRLVLAVPAAYDETTNTSTNVTTEENVNYTYDSKGYLSQISTDSTTYTFTYDYFGNFDTIKAGGNVLVDYNYYPNNGKFKSSTYGNGTKLEYKYDSLDRVKEICYTEVGGEPETLYEYFYTNDGYLKRFDDHVKDVSVIYTYDGSGKLINMLECGINDAEAYYSVNYLYDDLNRDSGTSTKITHDRSQTSYVLNTTNVYDQFGRITNFAYSGIDSGISGNVSLVYDNISRVSGRTVSLSGISQVVNYFYEERITTGEDTTSTRVKTYQSTVGNTTKTYTYSYHDSGNIYKEIAATGNSSTTTTYSYDNLGQLTSYSRGALYTTYSYDNAGNILSRTERNHYTGAVNSYTYTYGNSQWGDLLTAFNGQSIEYDEIGNPTKYYDGSMFVWTQGRRLSVIINNGSLVGAYTYNEGGIRTQKTANGRTYDYILNGSQIVAEKFGSKIVIYLYDELGSPIGMMYRYTGMTEGTYYTYFFEKNMFGDIVAVYDTSGVKQISYTYDAFGKFTETIHVAGTNATLNNFRYRGYYYDSETGFYYLNSRYYDPNTCRFISADIPDILLASPMALTDKNLFAYCDNNPVIREDNGGMFWDTVFDVVSLCISVAEVVANPYDPTNWVGLVGDTLDLIPFVTGVGEVTRAVNQAKKVIDKSEDALDAARKLYKGADKASDWRKATGSYEILYENGKTYVGKGGFKRAIDSAKKHKDGQRVVAIRWEKADNARQAFIDEYKKMCHYGGPNNSTIRNKNSLNSIWSPGRKYYLEDFGNYYSYGGKLW